MPIRLFARDMTHLDTKRYSKSGRIAMDLGLLRADFLRSARASHGSYG